MPAKRNERRQSPVSGHLKILLNSNPHPAIERLIEAYGSAAPVVRSIVRPVLVTTVADINARLSTLTDAELAIERATFGG